LLDHLLEGGQIDFVQRPGVDDGVDAEPLVLSVVGGEMFERGADTFTLDAGHQLGCQFSGQQRVFREILEIAAAERGPFHIDARPQQNVDLERNGFGGQRLSHSVEQGTVPGGGQQRCGRKAGGGQARSPNAWMSGTG
jgi:hypothetical protein